MDRSLNLMRLEVALLLALTDRATVQRAAGSGHEDLLFSSFFVRDAVTA